MPTPEQLHEQRIQQLEAEMRELKDTMKDVLPAVAKLWAERRARKQEGTT